jgi:hypothetical protein
MDVLPFRPYISRVPTFIDRPLKAVVLAPTNTVDALGIKTKIAQRSELNTANVGRTLCCTSAEIEEPGSSSPRKEKRSLQQIRCSNVSARSSARQGKNKSPILMYGPFHQFIPNFP